MPKKKKLKKKSRTPDLNKLFARQHLRGAKKKKKKSKDKVLPLTRFRGRDGIYSFESTITQRKGNGGLVDLGSLTPKNEQPAKRSWLTKLVDWLDQRPLVQVVYILMIALMVTLALSVGVILHLLGLVHG